MKLHLPNRLELWSIGLSTIVIALVILSNGTTLVKIGYLGTFLSLICLILTNQNYERN